MVSIEEVGAIEFAGKRIEPEAVKQIPQTDIVSWPSTILMFLVEKWLWTLGYIRSKQTHHSFVKFMEWDISDTGAGKIREHECIILNYDQLSNGYMLCKRGESARYGSDVLRILDAEIRCETVK